MGYSKHNIASFGIKKSIGELYNKLDTNNMDFILKLLLYNEGQYLFIKDCDKWNLDELLEDLRFEYSDKDSNVSMKN
tara:strand:+ start:75 stop:305 length:231 start_codon:yes stop_codon:yes gene_type:complete